MRLLEPWTLKLVLDAVLLDEPLPAAVAALLPEPLPSKLVLLYLLGLAMVLVALTGGLLYYLQRLFAAMLGQQVASDLRLDLYAHIQRLSFAFHDRRRTGDVLVRLTSDIRMLREALVSLPLELVEHLLLTVGMLLVMLFMDWQLALLATALVPGLAVLVRRYRRPMKKAIRHQREREGHLATIASETLGAVRVVQGFRRERDEVQRFGGQNRRSLRSGMKAARLEAKFKWSADVAVAVVTALVITAAARRVLAGSLTPGDLVVFVSYLRIYARPLRRISRVTERMVRATTAGERVLEILRTRSEVADAPHAVAAPRLRGGIRFEAVWFAHRKPSWVLEDVSLEIAPGECVALCGPTGSGKTTLVSLIPRFFDATGGSVRVDGRDVRDLTLASLRRQISLVFQEPVLFATSIGENIAYGHRDASDEDVRRAAERAGIHPIIARLPDGYGTIVGERGGTLSGGQRQCVAIARAIIRDAPIVILDEPTTGLDAESATLVMRAIERLMEGRTVILVSHQLASVEHADRIVVLDRGRVVEEGTHGSLFERGGVYRSLRDAAGAV
jgi:ATP-binding cassette, subfamily B, bacterial